MLSMSCYFFGYGNLSADVFLCSRCTLLLGRLLRFHGKRSRRPDVARRRAK